MINYAIVQESIDFYTEQGFKRVESPWTVTKSISDITSPPEGKDFTIVEKNKVLVASGEQSFLYLYNKGFLPNGQFQTVTPCFRDETFTVLNTKYFIKNELIKTDSTTLADLMRVVNKAFRFFSSFVPTPKIVETSESSFDIFYKDVELGSYGIRECDFLKWIYGTGVAEPRLSRTMEKYGISRPK